MKIDSYKLNQVLQWWRTSQQYSQSASKLEKFLSIALRHYVIPNVDSQVNSLSVKEFEDYCSSTSVVILKEAMLVFEVALGEKVKQGKVKASTGKNYRWALNKFYGWLTQQCWWQDLWAKSEIKVTQPMQKLPPEKKRKRGTQVAMSLKLADLPEYLLKELEEYRNFRTKGVISNCDGNVARKPKLDKIKDSTYRNEENNLLYFWGYFRQEYPDKPLSLALITEIDWLDDFVYWAIENRGVTHSTGVNMTKTAISVCKFLNYHRTERRNWSDIELLQDLRDLRNEYDDEYKEEKKPLEKEKWAKKELTHAQAREVVNYLRVSCASSNGRTNDNS